MIRFPFPFLNVISRSAAKQRLRARAAFTLIELLSVVAIIGLLVALIVPALNQMKSRANSVKCAQNLRSWMTALGAYVADQNGVLPDSDFHTGSADDATTFLWPYMQAKSKQDSWDRFLCPVKQTRDKTHTQIWGDYGFNSFVAGKTMATIAQPSRFIYALDLSNSRWIGYSTIFGANPQNLTQAVPKPHLKKINAAYLDGHVQTAELSQIMRADLTRSTTYYSAAQENVPLGDPAYDQ